MAFRYVLIADVVARAVPTVYGTSERSGGFCWLVGRYVVAAATSCCLFMFRSSIVTNFFYTAERLRTVGFLPLAYADL